MQNNELLPCPFCWNIPEIHYTEDMTHCFILCDCMQARTNECHTEEEVTEAWNTRKPMERVVEDLECYLEVTCELSERIVSEAIAIVKGGVDNAG